MSLIFFLLFLAEGPGWTIKIEPIQYEYYPKEPMWFVIIGINETEKELESIAEEGFIKMDEKNCGNLMKTYSYLRCIKYKGNQGKNF